MRRLTGTFAAEQIPEGEAKQIREIAKMTVQLQEMRRAAQNGEALRGVHPKSHGCLNAVFTVNPKLRKRLQVGLFAEPGKRFKAKVRYSNAAVNIAPDLDQGKNGSRGMALKVLGVGGPVLLPDGKAENQDFLMINTPEFAFGDVRAYHRLTQALMTDPGGIVADLFFLPLKLIEAGVLNPQTAKLLPPKRNEPPEISALRPVYEQHPAFSDFGPLDIAATAKSFGVVQKVLATTVRNPLEVGYFTAAPIRFGKRRVARFSAIPVGETVPQAPFNAKEAKAAGENYLAEALKATIDKARSEIVLRFRAQVLHPVEIEGRQAELIEDATVAWDEEEFPWVDLATITISPKGQPKDLVGACKKERFTPWHALRVHEPIGGINRLRKPVYEGSADTRLGVKPARRVTQAVKPAVRATPTARVRAVRKG